MKPKSNKMRGKEKIGKSKGIVKRKEYSTLAEAVRKSKTQHMDKREDYPPASSEQIEAAMDRTMNRLEELKRKISDMPSGEESNALKREGRKLMQEHNGLMQVLRMELVAREPENRADLINAIPPRPEPVHHTPAAGLFLGTHPMPHEHRHPDAYV